MIKSYIYISEIISLGIVPAIQSRKNKASLDNTAAWLCYPSLSLITYVIAYRMQVWSYNRFLFLFSEQYVSVFVHHCQLPQMLRYTYTK